MSALPYAVALAFFVWTACPSHSMAATSATNPSGNRAVPTGSATDLAIQGEGYFLLRDPGTGETFATRRGDFLLDIQGRVTDARGFRLQGFTNSLRLEESYPADAPIGDLVFNKGIVPSALLRVDINAEISNILIDSTGRVLLLLNDGTQYARGQVVLQSLGPSLTLTEPWPGVFRAADTSTPWPSPGRPGVSSLGLIKSGVLDGSLFPPDVSEDSVLLLRDSFRMENRILLPNAPVLTQLQSSTDLRIWTPIYTNRHPRVSIDFRDRADPQVTARFYRAVTPIVGLTGRATDLAISGEGYFLLKDPNTGELFVTRHGHFQIDAGRFLTTSGGLRLQGHDTPIGNDQNYSLSSPMGDLMFDKGTLPTGLPATSAQAGVSHLEIDAAGRIRVVLTDGSQYVRGQLLLQGFENPLALFKTDETTYRVTSEARPLSSPTKPDAQRRRTIVPGALEIFP